MSKNELTREEYVEERLISAEGAIEDAIIASDNEDERGILLGVLKSINAAEFRHHDGGSATGADSDGTAEPARGE